MKIRKIPAALALTGALLTGVVFAPAAAAATGTDSGRCAYDNLPIVGASMTVTWSDTASTITATKATWSSGLTLGTVGFTLFDNTGAQFGSTGTLNRSGQSSGTQNFSFGSPRKDRNPYLRAIFRSGPGISANDLCTIRVRITN